MHWIALPAPHDEHESRLLGWQALRFTPRVVRLHEAWVLEVSASERLFGGRRALLKALLADAGDMPWAQGPTCRVALALLRLKMQGAPRPARIPDDLPLSLLDEAVPHVPLLERTGCRSWGRLRELPRAPVARRFGDGLLEALDIAYGERPAPHRWLQLPESFDLRLELPALATSAPELMWTAQRLLVQLQAWLRARQRGVLALQLQWTLDLKRLDGVALPPHEQLVVRTAEPAQEMAHLRRLIGERLERATLAAPANHLRLRTLETAPWNATSRSFLPEDNVPGDKLHQLVEKLSARLGEDQVLVPVLREDWRPERMQAWAEPPPVRAEPSPPVRAEPSPPVRAELVEALLDQPSPSTSSGRTVKSSGRTVGGPAALMPPWLLPLPLPLPVRNHRPWHEGPLRLLTRRQRVETGWWEEGGAVVRDYCIAHSERAGLLWIYCEHRASGDADWPPKEARWFLQGLYA